MYGYDYDYEYICEYEYEYEYDYEYSHCRPSCTPRGQNAAKTQWPQNGKWRQVGNPIVGGRIEEEEGKSVRQETRRFSIQFKCKNSISINSNCGRFTSDNKRARVLHAI